MNAALLLLAIAGLIATVWCWAFRDELRNVWMDWRLDREFRRRHRKENLNG